MSILDTDTCQTPDTPQRSQNLILDSNFVVHIKLIIYTFVIGPDWKFTGRNNARHQTNCE